MRNRIQPSLLIIACGALFATSGLAHSGDPSVPVPAEAPAPGGDVAQVQPSAAPSVDAEGKAIFEANCSSCHELSDATSQAKDLAGWTETIAKMVSYGAPVATEDQQRIAAYLAATYPAPRL